MYHYALKKNGDLIVEINQERLPMDLTKDAFLDMLVSLPRPVCIGFRLQKDRLTQHQDEFNNEPRVSECAPENSEILLQSPLAVIDE